MTISIEQAQERLAELVDRSRRGEEIVITKDGQSVARLVPQEAPSEAPGSAPQHPWASCRQRLEAAGLKVPPLGSWNRATFEPLALNDDGPSVWETLVGEPR